MGLHHNGLDRAGLEARLLELDDEARAVQRGFRKIADEVGAACARRTHRRRTVQTMELVGSLMRFWT